MDGAPGVKELHSIDVDEIEWSGRVGLDENLGAPQHDFSHFSKLLEENASSPQVFLVILRLG